MRYCSLPDQLCDKEWFGQKTQKGWYVYDPSAPRKPLESEDTLDLIANYRQSQVICNTMQSRCGRDLRA